jgi:hypothetical protein
MAWQNFETIPENSPNRSSLLKIDRLRLPHGWLVRSHYELREKIQAGGVAPDIDTSASVSITFVPLGPAPWN